MNTSNKSLFSKRGGFFGLVMTLFVATSACDSTSAILEPEAAGTAEMATTLTEKLELNARQAERLREVMDKNEGAPGALWYTAAELQETLTAQQKETLLASMPDPSFGPANRRGARLGRQQGVRARLAGPRGPAFERLDLDLTDEQKEQIETLREQHRVQMETIREQRREGNLTPETLREQMQAMRESMRVSLEQILTEEQLEKLDARRSRFDRERPRGSGINRESFVSRRADVNSAMIDALELTNEQQERLKQLRENHRDAFDEFREQMRAEGADRETLQAEFRTKREAMRAEIEAVYSEKQQEIIAIHRALTLEAMRSTRTEAGRRGNRRFGRFNR